MGGMTKIASHSLNELLDQLRQEKKAEAPGDGTQQRNRDGVPGGTSQASGQKAVTSQDDLTKVETGERSKENSKDLAESYVNTPETQKAPGMQDKGNLSQEPLATTVEEAPKQDGNPKDKKDDSPTSHPASTEKEATLTDEQLSEKLASAITSIDGLIKKAEEESEEKKEGDEEKKEPEEEMTEEEKKAVAELEQTIKKAAAENPEAFQQGIQAGQAEAMNELVKQAVAKYPEAFQQGQKEAVKFSEEFMSGVKKAEDDMENLTSLGIAETVKKASDDADMVAQFLAGIIAGQQKKAGEEAAAADADAAAAAEALAGQEAAEGAEGAVGPEDAGALSAAIDEALAGVEGGGPASQEEIIEALANALVEGGEGGEMEQAINEQEKAAVAAAQDGKLRKAIKVAAIKKVITPKVKAALAKKAAAKKTRK